MEEQQFLTITALNMCEYYDNGSCLFLSEAFKKNWGMDPNFCRDNCKDGELKEEILEWHKNLKSNIKKGPKQSDEDIAKKAAIVSSRARICRSCDNLEKCGCTSCRRKNLNSKCPLGKWEE